MAVKALQDVFQLLPYCASQFTEVDVADRLHGRYRVYGRRLVDQTQTSRSSARALVDRAAPEMYYSLKRMLKGVLASACMIARSTDDDP